MDEYLETLKRFDECLPHLDTPADTSIYGDLDEDIGALQKTLEASLGLDCARGLGGGPYTAWYGSLDIVKDIHGNSCDDYDRRTNSGAALNIRFSNFGRLATIFGCNDNVLRPYPVEAVARHLLEANFCYIPIEVLLKPYKGVHLELSEKYSWFIRYFFYSSYNPL